MILIKYIPLILISVAVCIVIVCRWVEGIDYMNKNHFDYKGEDFLDDDDKIQIG